ncbi:MAG TPA: glycosyltransferase [Terracidiphilus sp.]|jgi:glycosyltransferase involved in cell wall biosynthesis
MNNLNILLVTYLFPPIGGTGVMRAASLARYLPAEGIRLDVLTTRNASAVGLDLTLLKEIPADVNVNRTITLDLPFGIKKGMKRLINGARISSGQAAGLSENDKPGFIKRVIGDMLLPDPQVTWLPVLTRAARRMIRKRNIDLVLITAPPFSNILLVEKLRKEFPRLAIVVDFRDEWLSTAFDLVSFLFSRSERARIFACNAEANAVSNTTAIVAVTEAARRVIRARYPQEPDSKFHLIPNGFDATKLSHSTPPSGPRPDGRIIVTYVGTVYASTEPTTLVQALQQLAPDVRSRFLLRFIGHIEEPRFREALLRLGEMVELKGYMPQHEALAAMNETDYVLLINHDPLNVGGKFYDYVGSGKPILGAVHPEGETRRLLDELHAGWWAGNQDVDGISQLFIDAANRGELLRTVFQPDLEKIAQYERKVLAQRYAALLYSIAKKQRDCDSYAEAGQTAKTGK